MREGFWWLEEKTQLSFMEEEARQETEHKNKNKEANLMENMPVAS